VDALAADSMSQVLVSNPAPGLYRFDGTNIAASGTLDSTTLPGRVRAIAIQEASSLVYLATDNGLLVCAYTANSALGTCTTFAGNNIPDNHVTSVTRSTAYLALGTQKGVFLTTTVAGSNTGTSVLMNENIGGTVASSGLLWIASRSSGLSSYNPVTSALVNHSGGPSQVLQAIALDASGAVWVGSDTGFGRYAPSQQQWTTWSTSDASDPKLVSNNVQCLAVTRVTLSGQAARDVIWLGTDAGVSRFDPSVPSFMTLTMSDGLPSNNVHSIAVLPSGNKVFGTAAGVALYSGH
jgi:ligand-binding sensor domain-containing protein